MPLPASRYFLDWSVPTANAVAQFLSHQIAPGEAVFDFSGHVVITPTREGGRRLLAALAELAEEQGRGVLPPEILTPPECLRKLVPADSAFLATDTEALLEMTALLCAAPTDFPALLPEREDGFTPVRDWHWARGVAEALLRVRDTLSDSVLFPAFADVLEHPKNAERERWGDMARIETAYETRLRDLGLADKSSGRRAAASAPNAPGDWRHIWLTATPAPTTLLPVALEKLAYGSPALQISVLISAPETLADGFDAWGCVLPEFWANRPVEWENFDGQIRTSATPDRMVPALAALLTPGAEAAKSITIGTLARDLEPFVIQAGRVAGVKVRPPEGRPLHLHWLGAVLHLWGSLLSGEEECAVPGLLRIPQFFRAIAGTASHTAVLAAWDNMRATHLPDTLDDMRVFARQDATASRLRQAQKLSNLPPAESDDAPAGSIAPEAVTNPVAVAPSTGHSALSYSLESLASWRRKFASPDSALVPDTLRDLLKAIFAGRHFDNADRTDRADREALEAVLEEIDAFAPAAIRHRLPARECLSLLGTALARRCAIPLPEPDAVPAPDWRELLWEDAPHLILAGLNDESVPGSTTADPFLPGSFREALGLPSNTTRLAVAAYTLQKLLAQRANGTGRLDAFVLQADLQANPLRPSRLLFLAPDSELPARARKLFAEPPRAEPEPAWQAGWRFVPPVSAEHLARVTADVSVTRFREYLNCPFRFLLKNGARMESFDAGKMEPDAREFGTAIHGALEAFALEAHIRDSVDAAAIEKFVHENFSAWLRKNYGAVLPLPVAVMASAARSRLSAFARVQSQLRADGWCVCGEFVEVKFAELLGHPFHLDEGGAEIHGKIDRVDFHEEHGWRVMDYKTSAKPSTPREAHLARVSADAPWPPGYARVECEGGGRSKARVLHRWSDLQLPLYLEVFRIAKGQSFPRVRAAYFNLPQAVSQTQVSELDGYTPDLHTSAITCARGVLAGIKAAVFWPPNPKPAHDDFEILLSPSPEAVVDTSWSATAPSAP